jgi:hypothetical protein
MRLSPALLHDRIFFRIALLFNQIRVVHVVSRVQPLLGLPDPHHHGRGQDCSRPQHQLCADPGALGSTEEREPRNGSTYPLRFSADGRYGMRGDAEGQIGNSVHPYYSHDVPLTSTGLVMPPRGGCGSVPWTDACGRGVTEKRLSASNLRHCTRRAFPGARGALRRQRITEGMGPRWPPAASAPGIRPRRWSAARPALRSLVPLSRPAVHRFRLVSRGSHRGR